MGNTSSRVSSAELKSAVVLALQRAEKGINGLPVPGVIGCISGVLKVIEQEEVSDFVRPIKHDLQEAHLYAILSFGRPT